MDEDEPGSAAPAALAVVVHVSEDDPTLALAVVDWRNGDAAARDRVVANLGGRLVGVVDHVAPGRDHAVAGVAVRRALDEAASGAVGLGDPAPRPTPADWNRRPAGVAAALALWHLGRLLGVPLSEFSGPAAALDVVEQATLRLLDVDLATWSQVGQLWGSNPNDVIEVHASARAKLGMDDPGRGLCPSWPAVRTCHLAPERERSAATWHVMDCTPCSQAVAEAAARRTRLLRLLPEGVAERPLLPGVGRVLRAFLVQPPIDQAPAGDPGGD